jgi:hypothetical protein
MVYSLGNVFIVAFRYFNYKEKMVKNCNSPDLCLGGVRFESQPQHWLS